MTVDDLLSEIAELGWSLRYLQQDWNKWAAMLYRGSLVTPRVWGHTPAQALGNAIEAIEQAQPDEPAQIYIPPKEPTLTLDYLLGVERPKFKLKVPNAQNQDHK